MSARDMIPFSAPPLGTISDIELAHIMNGLERVCIFLLSHSENSDDIHLALDAFERLTSTLAVPHPRTIVILHNAIIGMLGSSLEREGKKKSVRGLYIIEYSNKSVKIGCSSFFQERLRQLSTQGGFTVERNEFFPCQDMFKAEAQAHAEFKNRRLGGEFFELDYDQVLPRLIDLVKGFDHE